MNEFAVVLFCILVALAAGQIFLALGVVHSLRRAASPLVDDHHAPPATVILCLRGADPFLKDCVNGLLGQDYPDYRVRIVVDHPTDASLAVVNSVLQTRNVHHVTVETLEERLSSCSLKCSCLVQVVQSLDESSQFVALIDADTIAHPTLLRELATTLQDPQVAVATGNRWYMPSQQSVGSLVRYAWNAAAVVQMVWYKIPWGGTLAIKTRVFQETELLERWSHAFCEDTMLQPVARKIGMRVQFVPTLMMINREDCDLRGFFRWMRRQLLAARLYHPAWPAVFAHGIGGSLALAAAVVVSVLAVATGSSAAKWSLAGLMGFELSVVALLWPLEHSVRQIVARRGEAARWMSPLGLLKCIAVIPLTQTVYPIALISASLLQRVDWRGIRYRISRGGRIRMEAYTPYQQVDSQVSSSTNVLNSS